jgi:hypothetical protein
MVSQWSEIETSYSCCGSPFSKELKNLWRLRHGKNLKSSFRRGASKPVPPTHQSTDPNWRKRLYMQLLI